MTADRIEPAPALTGVQWERICSLKNDGHLTRALLSMGTEELGLAGLIASANEALPDSDPRKITREMVEFILRMTRDAHADDSEYGDTIAAAFASYLQPAIATTDQSVGTTRDGYAIVQFYYAGGPRDGQPFERPGSLVPHIVEHRDWPDGYYEANGSLARFEWRSSSQKP